MRSGERSVCSSGGEVGHRGAFGERRAPRTPDPVRVVRSGGLEGRHAPRRGSPDDLVQLAVRALPHLEFVLERLEALLRLVAHLFPAASRTRITLLGIRRARAAKALRDLCDLPDARLELLLLAQERLAELARELDLFGLGAQERLETVQERRRRERRRSRAGRSEGLGVRVRERVRRVRVFGEERVRRVGWGGRSRHCRCL